jgi:broad specificity phosphatase PhoE
MPRTGPSVFLARHGETEWSASGKHTSHTDIELTERGERAARALGERLSGRDYALVLTSPLRRARDTCTLAGLAEHAEVDPDLREFEYGDYEGLTTPEIREQFPGWDLWRDGCPGGETARQVGERVDRLIARALFAGGHVAMFAHGHVLRVLGARWLELGPECGGRLGLDTAALCELGFERERRVLWLWNG